MSANPPSGRETVNRESLPGAGDAHLILPPEVKQLTIVREPMGGLKLVKLYSVRSRDDSWSCSVEREEPRSFFSTAWHIRFQTSRARLLLAELKLNNPNVRFNGPAGEALGRVREAKWSLMGKSLVEDEKGQLLGCLVGTLRETEFRSADGTCIAIAKRDKSGPKPRPFRWREMHLFYRYVWNRTTTGPIDERLIYCYVCGLIQGEFQSGG